MSKYGEPWTRHPTYTHWVAGPDNTLILTEGVEASVGVGALDRAIACVNALAGMEPEDVKTLVELMREMLCWVPDGTRLTPEQRGAKMETSLEVMEAAHALLARLPKEEV